jgi:hypothetical protein
VLSLEAVIWGPIFSRSRHPRPYQSHQKVCCLRCRAKYWDEPHGGALYGSADGPRSGTERAMTSLQEQLLSERF